MKNILIACMLFCSPVYALNPKQQITEILKEDSDTIMKYAVMGFFYSMIEKDKNVDQKTSNDAKILINNLSYSSLQQVNNKLSGELDLIIKFLDNLSVKNPNTFIQYVIIGKTLI